LRDAIQQTWKSALRGLPGFELQQPAVGNASCSPFIRSIFPCRTGLSCSGGTGAEAQWLFMPEPDTRKTRLTRAAKQARTPDKFKP
jgi:hypothetical protein